tara:strand:- start:44 stop:190 length:147 start_codon:yes stop_codon:yes gene_type:complete
MDNCQNCGCEGHCPEPLYKEIDGNNIKVCEHCRCGACEKPKPDVDIVQ